MTDVIRKKDTGEPGNGGQFGHVARASSQVVLDSADAVFVAAYQDYDVDDYIDRDDAFSHLEIVAAEHGLGDLDEEVAQVALSEALAQHRKAAGFLRETVLETATDTYVAATGDDVEDIRDVADPAVRAQHLAAARDRHATAAGVLREALRATLTDTYLVLHADKEVGIPLVMDPAVVDRDQVRGWGYDPEYVWEGKPLRAGGEIKDVFYQAQGIAKVTSTTGAVAWALNPERNAAVPEKLRTRGWYPGELGEAVVTMSFPREMADADDPYRVDPFGLTAEGVHRVWREARDRVRHAHPVRSGRPT